MNIRGIRHPGSILSNTGGKPKSSSSLDTNWIAPQYDMTAHSSANNYVSLIRRRDIYRCVFSHCDVILRAVAEQNCQGNAEYLLPQQA